MQKPRWSIRIGSEDKYVEASFELPGRVRLTLDYRLLVPLILILLLGAAFRFTGINWDQGHHQHPDERFITMVETAIALPKSLGEYFNSAKSPLNPYNRGNSMFVYGTFPLFLVRYLGEGLKMADYGKINLLGRAVSALFDLGTVAVVFLIGRRLYDAWVGLLAALLLALTVFHIQNAHFFTFDTFTVFFTALTFYFAVRVAKGGGGTDYALMGASFGLALACKLSVFWLALVIGPASLLAIYWRQQAAQRNAAQEDSGADSFRLTWALTRRAITGLVIAAMVTLLVVRIALPYAFSGTSFFDFRPLMKYFNDINRQKDTVTGLVDYPPMHQYASTPAYIYPLKDMVIWGMGVPLGLAAWAGFGLLVLELIWKRRWEHLLPVIWIAFNFFYYGGLQAKTMRYFLPMYPFLVLAAAYLLVQPWHVARRRAQTGQRRLPHLLLSVAAIAVVVGGSFLWTWAFTRIYARPYTRVEATDWIYANIPPGMGIANEHWDDPIPFGLGPERYAEIYNGHTLELYAEDEPSKLARLEDVLNSTDYIFMTSNRLYASIPRLPMRFPLATEYYRLLFAEELGFKRVATFSSYPTLFGFEFSDDRGRGGLYELIEPDESFTVYDHPKVLIYEKTPDYSPEKVHELLGAVPLDNVVRLTPRQAQSARNLLMFSLVDRTLQRVGGTWRSIFNRDSLQNRLPVVVWYVLVQAIGLIAFPIGFLLFRSLGDRGWILNKSLGILLVTWLTWMIVNLRLASYTRTAIGASLLLLAACSGLIFWRRREQILSFWTQNRRLILVNEGLFLLFFLVFLLIRYGNPDLWHPAMGGEKPMDFAYLNAVVKSSIFPPYDPWFAGGYLNYYYFGQIILATLIKFTGIVPWVAYNLAIPLLAALTAMGAFSVVYNLTVKNDSSKKGWWQPALLWGLLAALMVAVLGNLGEIGVWLMAVRNMGTVDVKSSVPLLTDVAKLLSGAYRWLAGNGRPSIRPEWPYWNPSRIMPNGEINEFPFFTFLYADLHAHLIALPFTLLALGIAVSVIRRRARPLWAGGAVLKDMEGMEFASVAAQVRRISSEWISRVDWSEVLLLGIMALVIGALRPINSWDYPTYLLVVAVALALREYEHRGRVDFEGLWAVAWRAGAVLLLSQLLFWPFLSRFATAYVSFERWRGPRTGLGAYLVIHGLFLWAIVSWMGVSLFGRDSRQGVVRMLRLSVHYWHRVPRVFSLYSRLVHKGREFDLLACLFTGAIALLLAFLCKSKEWFYVFVLLLILGTLLVVLRWRMEPKRRFVWLLFGMGLALSLVVDLVVLKGDIGRMNTVFKFYLQIWVLWSVAAVVGLSYLTERLRRWPQDRRRLWWGAFAFLFFLASLYPVLATRAKINDRFDARVGPTLDGMAYMNRAVYWDSEPIELRWDRDAINWLLDNVEGSPVIAEANTEPGLYRWGARVANYTGLPTIIGWSWHQRQQRSAVPGTWIDERINDVRRLYSDPSSQVALDLLQKYQVRYIYLGDVERIYYPGPGLDKFEVMRAQGLLNLVYHNERVMIYEVVGYGES